MACLPDQIKPSTPRAEPAVARDNIHICALLTRRQSATGRVGARWTRDSRHCNPARVQFRSWPEPQDIPAGPESSWSWLLVHWSSLARSLRSAVGPALTLCRGYSLPARFLSLSPQLSTTAVRADAQVLRPTDPRTSSQRRAVASDKVERDPARSHKPLLKYDRLLSARIAASRGAADPGN
jgi:hypothetical protein